MNEQITPVRLSFLKDQTKHLEGMVLTISNFLQSTQGQRVAIVEMGNLYLHDSLTPVKNQADQLSSVQLYGENVVSKKAVINLESYLNSNLGSISACNIREVIEDDGEAPDKIFYYGSNGLIMLRMTSQADDD